MPDLFWHIPCRCSPPAPKPTFTKVFRCSLLLRGRYFRGCAGLHDIVVKGSVVSLFWSLVMLALIYYLFGLIFVQSSVDYLTSEGANAPGDLRDELRRLFGSVSVAMLSLFKACDAPTVHRSSQCQVLSDGGTYLWGEQPGHTRCMSRARSRYVAQLEAPPPQLRGMGGEIARLDPILRGHDGSVPWAAVCSMERFGGPRIRSAEISLRFP